MIVRVVLPRGMEACEVGAVSLSPFNLYRDLLDSSLKTRASDEKLGSGRSLPMRLATRGCSQTLGSGRNERMRQRSTALSLSSEGTVLFLL